jgi:hypothetical protein
MKLQISISTGDEIDNDPNANSKPDSNPHIGRESTPIIHWR